MENETLGLLEELVMAVTKKSISREVLFDNYQKEVKIGDAIYTAHLKKEFKKMKISDYAIIEKMKRIRLMPTEKQEGIFNPTEHIVLTVKDEKEDNYKIYIGVDSDENNEDRLAIFDVEKINKTKKKKKHKHKSR